jgi:hypothetical protein
MIDSGQLHRPVPAYPFLCPQPQRLGSFLVRLAAEHPIRADAMRSILAISALIIMHASANAATVHRSTPRTAHLHQRQDVTVRPSQSVRAPARFAVPGWTDEQTQYWLDSATSCAGCG